MEFLIMIEDVSHVDEITTVAEKIMSHFRCPFNLTGHEYFITISMGIAIYPQDSDNADDLIQNSDLAMYKAKSQGKNQYMLCDSELKEEMRLKARLSNSLYRALEKNELTLHYQPQIDLLTGQIIGLEALLRWNHPEFGMVSPAVFIPLAESSGLISGIGEWVIRTACRQNKAWQDMGLPGLRVAVNLSVHQFRNPGFVELVREILLETGLSPEYFEVEVTESAALNESDFMIEILSKLKAYGISISIDDFGTEYSSLSRLKVLPADRIKIDMQFVRGLDSNVKDQAITNVIISLGKSLGLHVIAEGVETPTQLEFLKQHACDEVQGYYYYKPMPA